jgi:hypothetical protein
VAARYQPCKRHAGLIFMQCNTDAGVHAPSNGECQWLVLVKLSWICVADWQKSGIVSLLCRIVWPIWKQPWHKRRDGIANVAVP